ncbi:MAG: insulinase family protein [Deltaproteobacteria bacterium]|nr:insulinase family protein [Deltaproteobacteria bacterium]
MNRILYIIFTFLFFSILVWGCNPAPVTHPDLIEYPPLKFSLPQPEKIKLNNGITLYVMEDHELPLLNISAVIRTGSIYDPAGKEGLADITGNVMRIGGTAHLTGSTIDSELDYMAATISFSMDKEQGTATLSVLKKDMEKGLKIFSDIIINPVFEKTKLDLAKELKIEALKRIYDNPQQLAFREFVRLIYRGNPRGCLPSVESIERMTRADLVRFHKNFFFPQNIMMAVTGDITKDEAVSLINRYFGEWNVTGSVAAVPVPERSSERSINYASKDSPQSIIIVGYVTPGKRNPDYYSFEILDFILGSGGFRSRIVSEVRTNLGLAYSAGSFYSTQSEYGVFAAYAMTKTSSTVQTLSAIRSILHDAIKTKVTKEELAWAKKSINNNFIFSFSSVGKVALQQMMLEYQKLPEDFLTSFQDRINGVTSEDLQRVAERYITDRYETIFVLGNEKEFDKPLVTLGKVHKVSIDK